MTNKPNFRIAMRREGEFWNAYIAQPDTMVGAVLVGSLSMTFAQHPGLRNDFMALMASAVRFAGGELVESRPAPEHERSGSA